MKALWTELAGEHCQEHTQEMLQVAVKALRISKVTKLSTLNTMRTWSER
jgi:hypothetical protein